MQDCIFCRIIKGNSPAEIIYEDDKVVALLDITPHTNGHTLIVPKEHYSDMLAAPAEVIGYMAQIARKIAPAVVKGGEAQGFNLGLNNGEVAGQVVKHLHLHVIPRSYNDSLKNWEGTSYNEGDLEKYGARIRLELSNIQE